VASAAGWEAWAAASAAEGFSKVAFSLLSLTWAFARLRPSRGRRLLVMLLLFSGGCGQLRLPKSVPTIGRKTPTESRSANASPAFAESQTPNPEASRKLELAIRLETAELARKRGMDREAVEQYLAARKLDPQLRGVAHPLAVLFDRAGQGDAAEREYRTALVERPGDADVLCDYGYFLHGRRRFEAAETTLRSALNRQPDHQQATVNLALVVGTQGNYEESRRLFERAIGPAAALHNVGMLKLQAGDREAGLADLRTAAGLDPSLTETREVMASLATRGRF